MHKGDGRVVLTEEADGAARDGGGDGAGPRVAGDSARGCESREDVRGGVQSDGLCEVPSVSLFTHFQTNQIYTYHCLVLMWE